MTDLIVRAENGLTVIVPETALELKNDALFESRLVKRCESEEDQAAAIEAQARLKGIIADTEKQRVKVKEPGLEFCRLVDSTAKAFSADLQVEFNRIGALVVAFQRQEEEKRQKAEFEREEELRRIESERLERESEANRKAQEAEIERLKEVARLEALEKSATADQQRQIDEAKAELDRQGEANRARLEQENIQAAELAAARQSNLAPVAAPVRAEGQTVKKVWLFDVVNVWDLVKARPDLVTIEPKRSEINAVIASGVREIKGLRIYEEIKTNVRAARGPAVINV